MPEVNAVRQALAQSQALEQVQEASRRQGETQQQSFAVSLNRHVAAREQRVNQGERPPAEEANPEARREGEEEPPEGKSSGGKAEDEEQAGEDDLGRHVDVRA